MPYKDKKDQAASGRRWFLRHRKQQYAANAKREQEIRVWYTTYKTTLFCVRCGENHPACLQFHHKDPKQKLIILAKAVPSGWGRKKILAEIEKCEVLCANCHFKEHSGKIG